MIFNCLKKKKKTHKIKEGKKRKKMGRKKKIIQVVERERVDETTGEISVVARDTVREFPVEENYVKVFCNCLSRIVGLTQAESDVFHRVITTMGYNNIVCFSGPARELIAQSLNISCKTLEKAVKELKAREIIVPIKISGRVKRGWYVINPNYVAKGTWKQIEALKMMITIESNGDAYMSIGARCEGVTTMSDDFPIELPKELTK